MKRNDTIDFIKFFAIFLVVCIHTAPFSTYQKGDLDGEDINFIINVFARWGVPYFFVVSGYLLAQNLVPLSQKGSYLKKYLQKNIRLLVSWSLFFFLYDLILTAFKSILLGLPIKVEMSKYLGSVFRSSNLYYGINEGTSYHLWYLASLIWAMITLFIFIKMNKVKLLLGISLILHLIGLLGQSYAPLHSITWDTRDGLFFGLFYVTLGFYVSTQFRSMKLKPQVWIILFLLLSLFQVFEGELVVSHLKGIWGNYYFFTIPTTVTLLFIVHTKRNVYHRFVNKLGANSVGIYVIHPFFISVSHIAINIFHLQPLTHTFIWNLLFTPIIFIVSYSSYQGLQLIKYKLRRELKWS